jgi:small-conductance mechanosensitive channel
VAKAKEPEVVSVASEYHQRHMDGERKLQAILKDGRAFASYEELLDLQMNHQWEPAQVASLLKHQSKVVQLQMVAGTSQQREELEQAAADADSEFNEKAPKLDAEIQKLTQERNALERKAAQLAKRHDDALNAVESLQALVPEHIKRMVDMRRKALNNSLRREINDNQTRIDQLKNLLDPSKYENEERHAEAAKFADFNFAAVDGKGRWRTTAAFDAAKPEMKKELAELELKVKGLTIQYNHELDQITEALEVYSK